MPSARVCRIPNGPALFGPIRFCMPAMILRSNQTMNIVAMSPMAKITTTFRSMMMSGVHSRSPTSSGSMASTTYILSTRTSVTGDARSTMSAIDAPGTLNGTRSEPRATRSSGVTATTTVPRGADDPHLLTGGDAEWVEVERVDVGRARHRQRCQRRRVGRPDRPVVELARHHESIVVADPIGADDRRVGQR